MRFDDKQILPGEEWYYEIDGRSRGPLSRIDLEELLSRCGETAAEVRIRRGADGQWTPFRSGSPTANTPRWQGSASELSGPSAEKVGQSGPHRSVTQAGRSDFRGLLLGHWDIVAAVGVWILINVLFLLFWPQPYARERRYLATLQGIVAEADRLRAKPASDREWQELARRTGQTLGPMVRDLEKSANSSVLVRQQLLWCARDLAPRIIGPQSKERDGQERRLKQYLNSVAEALRASGNAKGDATFSGAQQKAVPHYFLVIELQTPPADGCSPVPESDRNAIDLTFKIVYNKCIKIDLSADVSGLIPSDLDTERGLVRCLIVDRHCSDPTSSLPRTRFPLLTLRDLIGISGSRVNRVLTGLIEKGRVEKARAMDGRRGAPGFRVTREWADSSSRTTRSNWTSGPVQLDRTDTPNLASAVSLTDFRVPARSFHPKTKA